jgi:signal transduction protein with GAF and PtsI domain
LQLDDHLKNLLRELGHAINDTVSESERITGAIAGVRAHGYDIVLKLDATIGLAKRDGTEMPRMTTQDRRFLESLRIQVDQESLDQEASDRRPASRLTMTPQDVRFLKSLRIATDDIE